MEAANKVIKTQNRTSRNKWWDEECRQCIKIKKEARNKWLQQKTRASQESYIKRRKEANVLIIQKKTAWINNKILQILYSLFIFVHLVKYMTLDMSNWD
jgi:hypothetical protein